MTCLHSLGFFSCIARLSIQYHSRLLWVDDYFVLLPLALDFYYLLTLYVSPTCKNRLPWKLQHPFLFNSRTVDVLLHPSPSSIPKTATPMNVFLYGLFPSVSVLWYVY